jgi:hypothetical protein
LGNIDDDVDTDADRRFGLKRLSIFYANNSYQLVWCILVRLPIPDAICKAVLDLYRDDASVSFTGM